MRDDRFEWDDRKAALNLRRHEVDFDAARAVFDDDDAIDDPDDDPDELRFRRVGMSDGLILTVIYTERGRRIRIISARKATTHEQRDYLDQIG